MFKLSEVKAKANSILGSYKQKDPAAYAAAQEAVGGLLILDGFIGIDNPFGGKKRPGIFGCVTGIVFGLIFVFAGSFFLNVTGVNKMSGTTTATVVSVGAPQVTHDSSGNSSSTCSMVAKYTVNGKQYSTQSSDSASNYCGHVAGDTVTVNYNPDQPGSWMMDAALLKNIVRIFPLVGILIVLASLFTFVIRLLSIIFGWKLLKSGRALAKTLPGGSNLGSMVSQIREEFKHTLFNGPGAAPASPLGAVLQNVVNYEQAPAAPTVPVQPVATAPAPIATPAPAAVPIQSTPENTPPTPPTFPAQ